MTPEMRVAIDQMLAAAQKLAVVHKEPGQAVISVAIATGMTIGACSGGSRQAADAMAQVVYRQIAETIGTAIARGIEAGITPDGEQPAEPAEPDDGGTVAEASTVSSVPAGEGQ